MRRLAATAARPGGRVVAEAGRPPRARVPFAAELALLAALGLALASAGWASAAEIVVNDTDEAKARDFLRHTVLHGEAIDPEQLSLLEVVTSLSGTHLRFQQQVEGIRVSGGLVTVHVDRSRQNLTATGRFVPGADRVDRAPQVSDADALELALGSVGVVGDLRGPARTELVIYPRHPDLYLAWEVTVPAHEPLGDWQVFVDARSGAILETFNRLRSRAIHPVELARATPAPWRCQPGGEQMQPATLRSTDSRHEGRLV